MITYPSALLAVLLALGSAPASALTAEDVQQASLGATTRSDTREPDPFIVKAQVLLSRRSISPGVIDGIDGENYRKAIAQFRRQNGLGEGDQLDEQTWSALSRDGFGDIVVEYTVSTQDASTDFPGEIPRDYAKQAAMKRLSYASAQEMYAERFHMSEKLLKAFNQGADYAKAGERLLVVSAKRMPIEGSVDRIEAVKDTGMVVVFGPDERILASYPATLGNSRAALAAGDYTIKRIARNPTYHYDPEKNFQQGDNTEKLVLPPGPNNPVGTVWIGLSKPTFGIHGTPEPSLVSKTSSHGCIRLTNWDAEELAAMVKPDVPVRIIESQMQAASAP
ncbi:MAG TPA: L,D-transpeptidase [Xanthobacteraceae bacterium]|nr:L,D-transpeptidase [Xanthobacteraceae bacterium]